MRGGESTRIRAEQCTEADENTHRERLRGRSADHGGVVRGERGECAAEVVLHGGGDFVVYGRVERTRRRAGREPLAVGEPLHEGDVELLDLCLVQDTGYFGDGLRGLRLRM